MSGLQEPFYLGKLKLPNNIFYSPLAGCSDYSFRKMSAIYRPGLHFCEMVKMEALLRYDRQTFHLLDFSKDMSPIGAQIVGGNPKLAGAAARIIEELGFDVVDLNCGCPVDKVTKDGSGSGLLRSPECIAEILHEMVQSVSIPVTVKIRMGWDSQHVNAQEITSLSEKAGAQIITIHGRTRAQGYKGPATWDIIKECKSLANNIMVFGNGDVFDPYSAKKMLEETNCDGFLVSRGTLGAPWAVKGMLEYLRHGMFSEETEEQILEGFKQHFSYVVDYQQDKKAVIDARRLGVWYLKQLSQAKKEKVQVSRAQTIQEVWDLIERSL